MPKATDCLDLPELPLEAKVEVGVGALEKALKGREVWMCQRQMAAQQEPIYLHSAPTWETLTGYTLSPRDLSDETGARRGSGCMHINLVH